MALTIHDFSYDLPAELIAQKPATPRDSSRLMVVNRAENTIQHHVFHELPDLLSSDFTIVRNNTKVLPARLFGQKESGGQVEVLLLQRIATTGTTETWECMTKPGLKVGQQVHFPETKLTATCVQAEGYLRHVTFTATGAELIEILETIGSMPLPPYINAENLEEQFVKNRYQTLYAKQLGSAAAPTAGLHFTPAVDSRLTAQGIEIHEVTLHVGLGTFQPVKTEQIADHQMHAETGMITQETAAALTSLRAAGKKILSVGTTPPHILESLGASGTISAGTIDTELFIYPPHQFEIVDALLTNFHLPQSTLLMMMAAFTTRPNGPLPFSTWETSLIGRAYKEAIAHIYRFYSFGDAMLIL